MAQFRRVLLREPFGDLREPGVARDERRAAGCSGLGGDHAERLGEDRRHDARVGEGEQVDQVPVLQRAREQDVRAGEPLQLRALLPEPDDDAAGVDAVERLEEHVHALVADELPEVDDRRPVAGEEPAEALGVPLVGKPLLGVGRVRRVAPCLGQEGGERRRPLLRSPVVEVDPRRDLVDAIDVAAHVLEHAADVGGADEGRSGLLQTVSPPRRQGRVAPHGVLELRAVCLHREARAAGHPDRSPEKDVVAEDEVGREVLAEGLRVRFDPAIELVGPAVLHELDLVPLVTIEHEDRQQPADVGRTTRAPPRSYASGRGSWLNTVTSCPARIHARASWRV